jgi:hypothetical protein
MRRGPLRLAKVAPLSDADYKDCRATKLRMTISATAPTLVTRRNPRSSIQRCGKNLERRAGIEPANTGFADLRVDRFATGALLRNAFGTTRSWRVILEHSHRREGRLRLVLPNTVVDPIRPGVDSARQIPDLCESRLIQNLNGLGAAWTHLADSNNLSV